MSLVHAFCQLSAHFKLSTPGFVQGCKVDVSWRTEQLLESCLLLWQLESRSIAPKRPGRQPPDCFSELQNTKSQLKSIANRFPALRNMSRFGVCLPVQSPLSLCAVLSWWAGGWAHQYGGEGDQLCQMSVWVSKLYYGNGSPLLSPNRKAKVSQCTDEVQITWSRLCLHAEEGRERGKIA